MARQLAVEGAERVTLASKVIRRAAAAACLRLARVPDPDEFTRNMDARWYVLVEAHLGGTISI